MGERRWQALMARLSLPPNADTCEALLAAYTERHRHYHTVAHIDRCLGLLEQYRELAAHPDEVELALWFHDAVYRTSSKENEALSADWAGRFLGENNCAPAMVDRVRAFIMATVHDGQPGDDDAKLLVDIDLSILGAEPDAYERFEADVRREYRWVPRPLFRRERKKILQSFLDRERIYSTDALFERYEDRARSNLMSAIEAL